MFILVYLIIIYNSYYYFFNETIYIFHYQWKYFTRNNVEEKMRIIDSLKTDIENQKKRNIKALDLIINKKIKEMEWKNKKKEDSTKKQKKNNQM